MILEKILEKVKMLVVVALVILVSLVAFWGVFWKDKGVWKNAVPDYQYGMELEGRRELRYGLDTSEQEKYVYVDENGNIKYSNLKTNKEGEILIENMLPGKYFIEEVNTINGYQKLEEKIEIDLTLNEELTITIENEKEKIEPKKEKSYSERITKLPVTGM